MDSSSAPGSSNSNSREPTTAPSSPPAPDTDQVSPWVEDGAEPDAEILDPVAERLRQEEENARKANEAAEKKRRAALKRRNKKKKEVTPEDRKQRDEALNRLMKQAEAFSGILTQRSGGTLGQVGSGLAGKAAAEQEVEIVEQPKCLTGGTMRDYQLEGLTWLLKLCEQGISGILADEMGLGKTIQTVSVIAHLREKEDYLGPHLIVAPLSTLSNWIAEFNRWTPTIPVVMYHGTPAERSDIAKNVIFKNLKNNRPTNKFPVVCTSYEMVLKDRAILSRINWEFIIIDEGHRMKNFDSKLYRELQTFKSATRLLITGTPLQNNLKELWSLLHFLLPDTFKSFEEFEDWFDFDDLQDEQGAQEFVGDEEKQKLVNRIHHILRPFLLRRIKVDVAAHLPKKREYVLFAPMTKDQTDLYNAITDPKVDTREYLESKVVERLTKSEGSAESSAKASPLPSRGISPKPEPKQNGKQLELSIRSSPRKKKDGQSPAPAPVKNDAFAMMMGKTRGLGRPRKEVVAATTEKENVTPPKTTGKRKNGLGADLESPASKSAKSSRHSTPGTARTSTPAGSVRRGRSRKTPLKYHDNDASDDDLLDDTTFEAKLAAELESQAKKTLDPCADLTPEERMRSEILTRAKKEMSTKKLGNPLLQLRLVCNSPHNFYNPWGGTGLPVDETIVTSSGKMLLLDRLLPALFERGHKVLIFSQFKTQLDILEDYCRELRGWDTCRIDGGVAQDERRAQIERFNEDEEMKLFLLSTRAGGQGINLASADTVILFDSDWNPQQDLQAQDRAHRIGQTRPVIVYRLATKGTVEETLLMSADAKRRLEKLVIKKGDLKTLAQQREDNVDAESLMALLLRDGERYKFSGEKEVLSEEDLEVLCDRTDEAYERAATGQGNANKFTVVETGVDGITEAGAA
ncbi:snf2 family helicase ATPase [Coniochaeta sp. 2T2.1]|nr:snf2 family helicase ATPase [Coniochaeta sp. 2T2.1]